MVGVGLAVADLAAPPEEDLAGLVAVLPAAATGLLVLVTVREVAFALALAAVRLEAGLAATFDRAGTAADRVALVVLAADVRLRLGATAGRAAVARAVALGASTGTDRAIIGRGSDRAGGGANP